MQSIVGLEKKMESLADQIKDTFFATELNMEALIVQLQAYNQSKVSLATIAQCQKDFANLQYLFHQRATLRLQYLITEQIKEEEAKVRRQRLVEYEQKIYDQRRLISDKEAFFEALLRPRKKRPNTMSIEQFQAQRRKDQQLQEKTNLKRLERETNELRLIEKAIKKDNQNLQKMLSVLQNEKIEPQELQRLAKAIEQNPIIYESVQVGNSGEVKKDDIKRMYEDIVTIENSNDSLYQKYLEQKQLQQYLKWEHKQLRQQYAQRGEQHLQSQLKHRQKIAAVGRYRLKRSCSI